MHGTATAVNDGPVHSTTQLPIHSSTVNSSYSSTPVDHTTKVATQHLRTPSDMDVHLSTAPTTLLDTDVSSPPMSMYPTTHSNATALLATQQLADVGTTTVNHNNNNSTTNNTNTVTVTGAGAAVSTGPHTGSHAASTTCTYSC